MGFELPASEPAPTIFNKAIFCQKKKFKMQHQKKTDIGGFAPPQVRGKTSKNCKIFLIF